MTAAFYKAARVDGTDFHSGRVRYVVGETVEHPTTKRYSDMKPNVPATYLSISTVPTDCTGMRWPCRLFRIEPVGRTVRRTDGQFPSKRGCRALKVIKELPAWRVFGPNGREVTAVIKRARALTYDEAQRLRAAWGAAGGAAWDAAGDAAWGAAGDAAWGAAGGAAWDAAWGAAGDAAWGAAWGAAGGAAWDAAWGAAGDAAWDAARALLVRDIIEPEHFDKLYGPWREVIGEPEA